MNYTQETAELRLKLESMEARIRSTAKDMSDLIRAALPIGTCLSVVDGKRTYEVEVFGYSTPSCTLYPYQLVVINRATGVSRLINLHPKSRIKYTIVSP